jgi:cell division protein FtsB
MYGARNAIRRGATRRGRRRAARPSWLSILIGIALAVVFGAAALKVARPYLEARSQAIINEALRQQIKRTRQDKERLRGKAKELKTDAGTEARAREEGWRRPEETPVLMPDDNAGKPQTGAKGKHQDTDK